MGDVALSSLGTPVTVLVVDDEPMLADLFAEWVSEKWSCETATSGSSALDRVDGSIDIVTLDRRMPDVSGDEVLRSIREASKDLQVLMASSVEPDFDILELPFDDYVRKPVDRLGLQTAIEGLLVRRSYKPEIQEFVAATVKIDLLEAVKPPSELAENDQYLALRSRADELRQSTNATLGRPTKHVDNMFDANADD